jgi:hypothetical protein
MHHPGELYYQRRSTDDPETPGEVEAKRQVAFRHEQLLADDDALRSAPVEVTLTQYRSRLGCVRARLGADWERLVDPVERAVLLSGRTAGASHTNSWTPHRRRPRSCSPDNRPRTVYGTHRVCG